MKKTILAAIVLFLLSVFTVQASTLGVYVMYDNVANTVNQITNAATANFKAAFFTATSTTATSTLPNVKIGNLSANTSAGLDLDSNNGTHIANLGVGSSANSVFYGGVNINGQTRLATNLTGIAYLNNGVVSTTTAGGGSNQFTQVPGGLLTATGTDYVQAAYFVASSTATSTFAGDVNIVGNAKFNINNIIPGLGSISRPLISTTTQIIAVGPTRSCTTIQCAINKMPHYIEHPFRINVDAGTYNEDLIIPPTYGSHIASSTGQQESIPFALTGSTTNPSSVVIHSVSVYGWNGDLATIQGVTISGSNPYDNENTGFVAYGSHEVQLGYSAFSGGERGITSYNSNVILIGVDFGNSVLSIGMAVKHGGRITQEATPGLTGTTTSYAFEQQIGDIYFSSYANSKAFSGDMDYVHLGRGVFYNSATSTTDTTSIGGIYTGAIYGPETAATTPTIQLGRDNITIGSVNSSVNTKLRLRNRTNSTRMLIDTGPTGYSYIDTPNFGIGTTTPASQFQVQGDFYLTGPFKDSTFATGTPGQVLLSTGTSTLWTATSSLGISSGSSVNYFSNSGANTTLNTGTNLQSPTFQGTSTATSSFAGALGVGTTTPISTFAVTGNATIWGSTLALGTIKPTIVCSSCMTITGTDSTTNGVTMQVENQSTGAAAYSGLNLLSDRASQTNYAGVYLNGSGYSTTTFGNANAVADLLELGNTMGPINIESGTSSGYIKFLTGGLNNSNERMRIDSSGKIGFGTTTPNSMLDIRVATSTNPLMIASSSGLTLLSLVASGFLGIGSTTPGLLLTVAGNGFFNGNLTASGIVATGTLAVTGASIFTGTLTSNGSLVANNSVINSVSNSASTGYVGLNTTSLTTSNAGLTTATNPLRVISIRSIGSSTAANTGTTTGTWSTARYSATNGTNPVSYGIAGAVENTGAGTTSIGYSVFGIRPLVTAGAMLKGWAGGFDGSVWVADGMSIGTTSTSSPLVVTGTSTFNGGVGMPTLPASTAGNAVCIITGGTVVNAGNTTCVTSSIKTKHSIDTIDGQFALATILRLRPVSYVNNEGGDARYGLIAEETNAIDPTLVEFASKDMNYPNATGIIKKGEPTGIDYQRSVMGLVLASVQEQQKQISAITGKAQKSATDNWQWIIMVLGFSFLLLLIGLQQYQIYKLKK